MKLLLLKKLQGNKKVLSLSHAMKEKLVLFVIYNVALLWH